MTPLAAGDSDAVTVGIDLGGTGTRIIALGPGGAVLREQTLPTTSSAGDALTVLASGITNVTGSAALAGIGIGASGPVDRDGVIRNDDTLPAYSHIPITSLLSDRFGVPCDITNDAVAAAIGENTYGAGQRCDSLLMVTLGTGIGVAVLTLDGPFRAADDSHPEGGHIPVPGPLAPCYCGLGTCWEQLASRSALDTLIADGTADAFTTYGQRVGTGVATLLTIFRPARIVIGGSAAQYLPQFASGFEQALNRSGEFSWTPPYAQAELGPLSGAVGAAVLARKAATWT
jgi:glucokinase